MLLLQCVCVLRRLSVRIVVQRMLNAEAVGIIPLVTVKQPAPGRKKEQHNIRLNTSGKSSHPLSFILII